MVVVPIYRAKDPAAEILDAARDITTRLQKRYGFESKEALLDHFRVDFHYLEGPRYIGPEPVVHSDGSVEDHFGVPRVRVEVGEGEETGVYREVLKAPLEEAKSLDEIRDYDKWPDADWFDYDCLKEQVVKARQRKKAVVFTTSNTPRDMEMELFGDPLENLWKNCIFGFVGVEDFHRRNFESIVLSTPDQRQEWLDEVRRTVKERFPPPA